MLKPIIISVFLFLLSFQVVAQNNKTLAKNILSDPTIVQVDNMARELMKRGFYAGSGYQMVWARDLNTFIEVSCDEYDLNIIRENLLMFFYFQRTNGELLDGYVEREAFNWDDPNTYESLTAPGHIGFKNTVESDQETSLIQAIAKYIDKTNDYSILKEIVAGTSVYQRLTLAVNYLLNERYSEKYGLLTGATTFDWGDVQVEGGAVVDIDSLTHWSIDIYDNAMFAIALRCMEKFTTNTSDQQHWRQLECNIKSNIRKYLWDADKNKFIPHIYINGSPFPPDFDENAIMVHGGTAIAIEAGILDKKEITAVLSQMENNVKNSGAQSIGLTLYPPYPVNVLGGNISPPYNYQNGGDWTWFGGRMIQQLIAYGFIEEAWTLAKPMFDRVLKNNGFFEWYSIDGSPKGSAEFKGSAGVLAKAASMFLDWAHNEEENK
jgi:Amylo-alpha-1,6-glucosidase